MELIFKSNPGIKIVAPQIEIHNYPYKRFVIKGVEAENGEKLLFPFDAYYWELKED